MGLFAKRLGVDLGTVNVFIYDNGQIVLQEPSLVALTVEEETVVEIGQPAFVTLDAYPDTQVDAMVDHLA